MAHNETHFNFGWTAAAPSIFRAQTPRAIAEALIPSDPIGFFRGGGPAPEIGIASPVVVRQTR